MNKRLFNQQNLTRRLRLLPVLCAMLLMPFSAWAQSITVAGVSPDADGNFAGLSGVTFNSTTSTLTLNGASIIPNTENPGIDYTGEDGLTISLIGSNTVKGGGNASAIRYVGNGNNTSPTLTFTKGDTQACSVQLQSLDGCVIDNFAADISHDGLYMLDEVIQGADQNTIYRTTFTSTLLSGGTGTSNDPFLIETKEDLVAFANYVNDGVITTEYVKLNKNINCSELTGFEPIGTSDYPFTGTFTNSDNYTISNLNCTTAGPDGKVGLFSIIGFDSTTAVAGNVSGLKLDNCSFSGGTVGGAIAGYLSCGTISNCLVTNCSVTTNSGVAPTSAGIAGESFGTITNCTVSGSTITASTTAYDASTTAGGIVGTNGGTISNCEVTGTSEHSTLIKSSYNDTSSDASRNAGGIVGNCIDDNKYTITVSGNSVNGVTRVESEDSDGSPQAGAIIGHCPNNTNFTLENNFYEYTVETKTINGNVTDERTGYIQRGSGDFVYNQTTEANVYTDITANNGALMATKPLTVGVVSECEFYEPLSDYQNGILALAPGQAVDISLYPADGVTISAASLVYTPEGGEEQTVALTNIGDPGQYRYSFEMPDADATLNATIVESYALWIGETQVTSENADDVLGDDGSVTFTVSGGQAAAPTYTLTLNDAALTVPVKVGLGNLTIDVQGANTITTDTTCIQNIAANFVPSLTFKSTSDVVGNLTLTDTDEENYYGVISENFYSNNTSYYTISKELALVMLRYGNYTSNTSYFTAGEVHNAQLVPSYGVQVGDIQIYAGNAADVFEDGTVSFDKTTNTLTLNGADKGALSTWLEELNVELIGNNKLTEVGSYPVLRSLYDAEVIINIQSTGETKGTLTMSQPYTQAGNFYDGNVTVNIVEPLAVVSGSLTGNKNNENTVVIEQIRNIGLTVSGVVVTNANAANVLGDGKVIYANGMLMLNGATLESGITSDMDQLKIVLAGTNSIAGTIAGTGTLYFATDDTDAKLTFTTESASAVSGFTEVTYLNGLRMKPTTGGFEVLIPSDYNLMVNGISVTPGNRKDVFGDGGSVIYDGEYTLILTNATLTQKIVLGSENTLDNLYIHLAGQNNTITSDDNVIVATAKPNMELHFVTNGNSPGKLVYTSTNASNPTLEGAFTGFSKVSFDNELEAILSGKTITLAQKIEPIINSDATSGKGSTANVDFTNPSPEMEQYNTSGANLNNMIVGDILFTLNDDGTKESPDGYDGSNVVINSEVSDEDLAAAMNLEPGSDAFAKKFNGLTFKLPASTGTIFIEARSLNGHQMCVKIGDQTATYITLTSTPTTYNVDYTCSTDTYVYIYLPQSSSSSAPRHVRGRIGPKSGVSGGLGNISVSSNSMVSAASSQPASNYMLLDRMAADAIISSVIPGEGLAFNDASITDLEDDMFLTGGGASSAPRRAAAPALKISSDLPFIDMRGTSIKNMEVSRSSGPFNGVPENVFIYMPAGNTTSEKNVVIGDVCDRMELKAELPGSGENEAKPFKVSKNFTAAQATLMRTFAEGGDESKATIYLPYAIPQEDANLLGQFFEFDGIDGGVVKMTKVTSGGLKANKPYIFQAKEGGVVNPEVKIVTVQGSPAETEGFKGVYEQTSCGGDNWYGYAAEEVDGATIGQFVKLGTGASIAPFRAYMVADGGVPSYAIRWGGVDEETTAIEEPEIKTVNERKPVEGWYTLTGARLVSQPTKPGLYIYNGRTVVVK